MHTLPALKLQQLNLGKLLSVLSTSAVITFALFVCMQKLISNNEIVRSELKDYTIIDFIQNIEEKPVIERIRIKPKPLPQPKPEQVVKIIENDPDIGIDPTPQIPSFGNPVIKNNFVPTFTKQGGDARPIVRIEPKYPSQAARDGIEGWVKLSFTITPLGSVNNIQVLDANPKRTFNQAARRALAKWKYKPNIQAGKAQAQDGMMVMLDFTLTS
jgi:protein TonB